MNPCPECEREMARDTSSGAVMFQCYCGIKVPGAASDVRIAGAVLNSGQTAEKYARTIRNAAFDRTNQLVGVECTKCGLDYMTQIRISRQEVVIWKCQCGNEVFPAAEAAADRARTGGGPAPPASKNIWEPWAECMQLNTKAD